MKSRIFAALAALLAAAGCVQTQELPLAANVYRLETSSSGMGAGSRVQQETMRRAAELTLGKGYTHFVLTEAAMQTGARHVGNTPVYANTTANVYGRTGYAQTTYSGGQPIYASTVNAGVTVVMFGASDKPDNALDAAQILAELKKKG